MDRFVVREGIASRLADSFETALETVRRHRLCRKRRRRRTHRLLLALRLPGQRFLASRRSNLGCSASTPRTALARPATGWVWKAFSTRIWSCPTTARGLADGAIAPWTGAQSPYYDQTLQSLARHYKQTTKTPWRDLPDDVRACDPARLGRTDRLHLQGWRPQLHGDETVRRRAEKPAAPLAGNRQRLGAGGNVPLPGGKALRGLQRRPPEAGSAVGAGRRQKHRRGLGLFHPRRAWLVCRGAAATDPAAPGNRRPHSARDRRSAALPGRCRAGLSDLGPRLRHAVRRRSRSASGWPARSAPG